MWLLESVNAACTSAYATSAPVTVLSCRYTARDENFVLVVGMLRGDLETDGFQSLVEIILDALIEPVQLGALVVGEFAISREGFK